MRILTLSLLLLTLSLTYGQQQGIVIQQKATENALTKSVLIDSDIELLGYNIYRDGEKLNTEPIKETYYDDIVPENGQYSYFITALYQEGESGSSNTALASVDTTKAIREYVVAEKGTGTWCSYCPGAALGFEDLLENDKKVLPIAYHNGDSYVTQGGSQRLSFYNISGFPTAYFDGLESYSGGSNSESLYDIYLPFYERRIDFPTSFKLYASGKISGDTYTVDVTAIKTSDYSENNLKLITVITEDHIEESWMGLSELNAVVRDMLPSGSGTALDFSNGNQVDIQLDFIVDSEWNKDNCMLVTFVQNMTTKEILQATKLDLTEFLSSKNQKSTLSSTLFPPYNLQLDYSFDSKNVSLSWSAPGSPRWQQWDNGVNSTAVGSGSSSLVFDAAARWTVDDLSALEGMSITRIAFFPCAENCDYSLRIWEGESAEDLVLDSLINDLSTKEWNEIVLQDTFPIDGTKELWVGYFNDNKTPNLSAGTDMGPEIEDKGGKIRIYSNDVPENWKNLSSYGIKSNWNLKFYVEPTIIKEPEDTVGVKDIASNSFSIYPNPASDIITIDGSSQINEIYIININGQVVLREQVNSSNHSIDVSDMLSGIYFIKVVSNSGYTFNKLIVE